MLVEAILSQLRLTREEPELRSWNKREDEALHSAMRTIALEHSREISLDLKRHGTTMASALIVGHKHGIYRLQHSIWHPLDGGLLFP